MFAQNRPRNRVITTLLKALVALGLVVGGTSFATTAQADDEEPKKIGYVDLQRALNSVEEGKQAKAKLEKDFEEKQQTLNEKQQEVKEMQESLESGAEMMNQETQQKKGVELQQEMAKLQEQYMEMQRDLAKKESEATQRIFSKMEEIIQDIAEEKDYDLVLEKTESSVLFAEDGMDLTDELIKRYNE
ncbi:MAG: OmpH family outer membrane protein [Persicimonas sp.]